MHIGCTHQSFEHVLSLICVGRHLIHSLLPHLLHFRVVRVWHLVQTLLQVRLGRAFTKLLERFILKVALEGGWDTEAVWKRIVSRAAVSSMQIF